MTPFRISEAVFIESAYISGEAKMSVSTLVGGAAARGPSSVEAIVGLPGGMFVKHQGRWNFCPWANVKSARLIDVPAEVEAVVEAAAKEERRRAEQLRAVGAVSYSALKDDPALEDAKVISIAVEPSTTVVSSKPERDAMGVLKALQPTTGQTIACGACGGSFVRGANHVCTRVDDPLG